MTKQKQPDVCDICNQEIQEGMSQYCAEIVQGNRLFALSLTKSAQMDICHKCFMGWLQTSKWRPNWKRYTKNTQYTPGSKDPAHKYWQIDSIDSTQSQVMD